MTETILGLVSVVFIQSSLVGVELSLGFSYNLLNLHDEGMLCRFPF